MCGLILICHNRFDGGGLTTTTKTTSAIDRSAAQRKRREMQAEKGKNGEIPRSTKMREKSAAVDQRSTCKTTLENWAKIRVLLVFFLYFGFFFDLRKEKGPFAGSNV